MIAKPKLFGAQHVYPPMLGPLEAVPAGSPEWAERLGLRIKFGVENTEQWGVERLIPWVDLALENQPPPWAVWPVDHPCRTPERYFSYAANATIPNLIKLIAAYKGDDHPLVRKLRKHTAEGERQIADENKQGGVLLNLHRDSMKVMQGNTTTHLLRRLARVRPDILAAWERGEYRTPTAAARAAGIKVDTPPPIILRRAWKRCSEVERAAFLAELPESTNLRRR